MIAEQGLELVTEGPLGMVLLSKSPDRHTTAVGRFKVAFGDLGRGLLRRGEVRG